MSDAAYRSRFRDWLDAHDPRPLKRCETCRDFGMLEDSRGHEDVCPTCEGGIWRERISWEWYFRRLELPLGLRIGFSGRRPYLYWSSPV